ncbi:MAG: BatA domain-containing protein [Planctomycetales bacterium]
MSLIHPALGWLLGLSLIPVILHLLMRPRPKRMLFPALRLIQVRRRKNLRRLRLKHLGLLLLRVGAIAGIVLVVARPRVSSANFLPTTGEWISAGVILVVAVAGYLILSRRGIRPTASETALSNHRRRVAWGMSVAGLLGILGLVVWPLSSRIRAEGDSPGQKAGNNLPVAAVLVFDTSLSMDYQQGGKTRLDMARDIARAHVQTLPSQSRVAVTDTHAIGPLVFASDLSGAVSRINRLETQAVSRSLEARLQAAIDAQREDQKRIRGDASAPDTKGGFDDYVREIYILTDLAASAWQNEISAQLAEQLKQFPELGLYIIDVGIEQPTNLALNQLKVSPAVVTNQGSTTVSAVLTNTSAPKEVTAEIYLESNESSRKLVKQGQMTLSPSATSPGGVSFPLTGLTGRYRQGEIRLNSSDPLAFDDVLRFTLDVLPTIENLVVSETREEAEFWMTALAPGDLVRQKRNSVQCRWCTPQQLPGKKLEEVQVVTLINVPRLGDDQWARLEKYVDVGGSLTVFLGGAVDAGSYNSAAAQKVLPVELLGHVRFLPPEFIDLQQGLQHPLFQKFGDLGITTLDMIDVRRYWKTVAVSGARVLAQYSDERKTPAVVERRIGKGRSVLVTTAANREGDWNDLPVHGLFVVFAGEMVRGLTQQPAALNYVAGETAIVPLPEDGSGGNYLLRKPSQQQIPVSAGEAKTTLALRDLEELGHYRLLSAEKHSTFERGFSVNAAPRENNLTRLLPAELDKRLGAKRWTLTRSMEDLQRTVNTGRIGVEIVPHVFTFLLLMFVGEHVLGNFFYRDEGAEEGKEKGTGP